MPIAISQHWSAVRRVACLALAALALSGCIIVPEHHARPFPGFYYYR